MNKGLQHIWCQPAKHLVNGVSLFILLGISACTLHDPYGSQRDRAPVEVRRGETYGRPAPTLNRPVYIPQQQNSYPQQQQPESVPTVHRNESQRNIEQSPPAVARLISQAEAAIKSENYALAASRAESALRLDPQSVAGYHTLARTYLFEGRYAESEQMALRAISFARAQGLAVQHEIMRNLWLLIAETRRNRGDRQGTERAMERAGGRY